ncbi:MAG: hypothetical protein M9924_14105 [Rhizobiaceae bacterium]|nr:hypothetical protein [Rhizobiaceae bacterium]
MKLFSRLFRTGAAANLSTIRERDRFARTMPGQTGAIAANRLGMLIR